MKTRPQPLALALAALLFAAACGSDEPDTVNAPPTEVTEVTLMLNWTPNAHHAGIYLAEANGYYDAAGIDLTIIEPAWEVGVEAAVAAGQADIGLAQAESLLPARAAGIDVKAVATLLPTNDSVLMGLASDGISDPSALEGATYGGFGGALETELISRLVTCGGGDPAAVNFVEVGNVDYLAGLEQDRFDVVWVFSGWDGLRASEVEGVAIDEIRFDENLDCIPDWYTPLALASSDMLDNDPALVRSFLQATTRGYAEAQADADAAADALLAAAPELDAELVRVATAYYASRFGVDGGWGQMDGAVWTEFADFLVDAGLLDEPLDMDEAWTNDFLPEG